MTLSVSEFARLAVSAKVPPDLRIAEIAVVLALICLLLAAAGLALGFGFRAMFNGPDRRRGLR